MMLRIAHASVLQQRQRMAAPGEVVVDDPPDQRAAVARRGVHQFGGVIHSARTMPSSSVRVASVRNRFGGEGEAQVMAATAAIGVVRRLPLVRADEGGQAHVPAGFLQRFRAARHRAGFRRVPGGRRAG